jgi:phage terminase large subunit-like protein
MLPNRTERLLITQQTAVDLATVFRHVADCKTTPQLKKLLTMDYNIVGNFSGNQGGKTWSFAYMYFLRVLGIHPIKRLNFLARKIRCMSPSLPIAGGLAEQDNTQYMEFKQMIPPELIVSDITARSQNLVVRRPDGSNSVIEFKSTNQEMQKLGRVQLSSVWHDEESPRAIRDECKMRLLAEGGDENFSLTPTNALSYTYSEIWQRAEYIYRTPTIQKRFNLPEEEWPNKNTRVGCVQMATDDNPTLDPETIDFIFEDITDPDELDLRRYGVFKQISGRVHKTYSPEVCYIDFGRLFA